MFLMCTDNIFYLFSPSAPRPRPRPRQEGITKEEDLLTDFLSVGFGL